MHFPKLCVCVHQGIVTLIKPVEPSTTRIKMESNDYRAKSSHQRVSQVLLQLNKYFNGFLIKYEVTQGSLLCNQKIKVNFCQSRLWIAVLTRVTTSYVHTYMYVCMYICMVCIYVCTYCVYLFKHYSILKRCGNYSSNRLYP